jgi:hypothetical protein
VIGIEHLHAAHEADQAAAFAASGCLEQLGHPFGAVFLAPVELAFLQQPGGAATGAGTSKGADGVEVHRHHPDGAIAVDDPLQAGGGPKAEALADRGGYHGLTARGDRAAHRMNYWRSFIVIRLRLQRIAAGHGHARQSPLGQACQARGFHPLRLLAQLHVRPFRTFSAAWLAKKQAWARIAHQRVRVPIGGHHQPIGVREAIPVALCQGTWPQVPGDPVQDGCQGSRPCRSRA